MRLESVSKLFTATLILQLDQQGKLHVTDTVERWLPGLLRSYGSRITIRELLTNRSGLISDSDLGPGRAVFLRQLARVKDARLRAQLTALTKHAAADPSFPVDPIWLIRWAAWERLLFAPGAGYHYSNLGYDIVGLIAERATGKPLSVLFQQHIFEPLGLKHTAYDPNGPIQGPHSHGYRIAPNGKVTDTTDLHRGKGADGGIVSDAQDTATFLIALMRGKLLDQSELAGMKGENLWRGGRDNGTVVNMCGSRAYGWAGEGEGYKTEAWTNGNGTRVAVLLLNAVHPPFADQTAFGTAAMLYCSA
jgi:D-alanyl-D-alanine carboxypeptidase